MSVIPTRDRPLGRPSPRRKRHYRLRRHLVEAGSVALGIVILFWSLIPVYNIVSIALTPGGNAEFMDAIWPPHPSVTSFVALWTEKYDDVERIWQQFGNSVYIGFFVTILTVLIGSLASFAVGRMRVIKNLTLTDAALFTYIIPSTFLLIPFFRLMHVYGLSDNLWAVIFAEVAFATPYAILVMQHYGKLIPIELDEAARIDGASGLQVYLRIYLPLMAPALAAIATYALIFAWNDFLYQYLLLTGQDNTTVAVALEHFFDDDDSPWNFMMAITIVYALPPIAVFYAFRRYMVTGLTLGGVKG